MLAIGIGIGIGIGRSSSMPSARAVQEAFEGNILLAAVVDFLGKTPEGDRVTLVAPAWSAILREIEKDPDLMFRFGDRKWEEIIAAAYVAEGYKVTLTRRSGDGGVDVIATSAEGPQVTIFDQVKAFARGHRVTANDVRALMGVVAYSNATKGVVTTTSEFAPMITSDPYISQALVRDIELVDGNALRERLKRLNRML
jgi:restriction system protein